MISMSTLADVRADLTRLTDHAKVQVLQRFFKTGKGQYGEGDVFIGVTVPRSRQVAVKYAGIPLEDVNRLLYSKIHEERLVALLILVLKSRADLEGVARFYIDNISLVNNWDLVDLSAPRILGAYLETRDRSILYRLAISDKLWERRIAIIATQHFIRRGNFTDNLKISEMLLGDSHDLMHKAVG
jgi:3-methyladenine DNA glycosylase AlkD